MQSQQAFGPATSAGEAGASLIRSSPSRGKLRAGSGNAISTALPEGFGPGAAKASRDTEITQSPASADSFSRMLGRGNSGPVNGFAPSQPMPAPAPVAQGETSVLHQHIQEMANKRISTLDYLRKAHETRLYWFNTILLDKSDLTRMPYFDSRKLARRATNYLLLGLSLPTVVDLNSSSAIEFLRSLNTLLSEFDAFQQLHPESGAASSLSRARLPQMFRRAPGGKGRRSTAGSGGDMSSYPLDQVESNVNVNASASASVISFAMEDSDLLPGEEYTHLLTPSLPFDPDYFETFATLCDVLIDAYTRLLSLLPSPRDCTSTVSELFTKADAKVRKIIIQGVVKELDDSTRTGARNEVANVGKVVLGGLM